MKDYVEIILYSSLQCGTGKQLRENQRWTGLQIVEPSHGIQLFFIVSFIQPNIQSNMVQKAHSKIIPTTSGPEDIQTDIDKDLEVKKHRHDTDTEDPPRKKVQHLLIITVKHSLADHDI